MAKAERASKRAMFVLAVALAAAGGRSAMAVPVFYGREATVYATVTDPFEIEFDVAGYLYAGHDRNAPERIYRIPPGGGAAAEWGTASPDDPDGIDASGDYVYAAGQHKIWQTDRATGTTAQWTTWTANRNMTTIVVDELDDYGDVADVIVGSARYTYDIEFVSETTRQPTIRISSGDLYIPRGLLFARGMLYCLETGATKGIWAISPAGDLQRVDDGGNTWGSVNAMVHSDAHDAFYVGDDEGRIIRVPRQGGAAEVVGTGFPSIRGMTFGPDGDLYVADAIDDAIWRVVPEPATLGLLGLGVLGVLPLRRRSRHSKRRSAGMSADQRG